MEDNRKADGQFESSGVRNDHRKFAFIREHIFFLPPRISRNKDLAIRRPLAGRPPVKLRRQTHLDELQEEVFGKLVRSPAGVVLAGRGGIRVKSTQSCSRVAMLINR